MERDADRRSIAETDPDARVIVLRIGRLYRPGMDEDQIYDATRGWWRAGGSRRQAVVYAVAVAGGLVRGVFQVDRWEQSPIEHPGRWGFTGRAVDDADALIGRDVSYLFPRGAANPVTYSTLGALLSAPVARLGLLSDALDDERPDGEEQTAPDDVDDQQRTSTGPKEHHELRRLTEELAAAPLFHASLGSKELFHSNVLAWLCEQYPDAADALLAPWMEPDDKQRTAAVLRERRQLDLVVVRPGHRPIVFENKVFSAPDEAQLDRYSADNVPAVVQGRATLVLLSLGDPGWPGRTYTTPTGSTWIWRSYDDVAAGLEERCLPLLDGFDRDFLAGYIAMLRALVHLLRRVLVSDEHEPVELPGEWKPLLAGVRLWDAARKLRSRHVANLLREQLPVDALKVTTSFHDGNTVITVAQRHGDVRLGWQLQGRQFRRLAMLAGKGLHGKGPAFKQARADYCAGQLPQWFDPAQMLELARGTLPSAAPMKTPTSWLHYDPDFVYRYVKAEGLTVAQLRELSSATTAAMDGVVG